MPFVWVSEIDIQISTSYNSPMDTLGQQTPVAQERDNSRLIIVVAVVVVIGMALTAAFFLRARR